MNREEFREEILALDVFDTHAHLVGSSLCSEDFWKLVHYFWFLRELNAAGYPMECEALEENKRIDAFLKAYQDTKNTSMNWIVGKIFSNLYGIDIKDKNSILLANEAVKASSASPQWPRQVADKIHIRKVVINRPEHYPFDTLPDVGILAPRIDGRLYHWTQQILQAEDQNDCGEKIAIEISELLKQFKQEGCKGIMTTLPSFGIRTYNAPEQLRTKENTWDDVLVYILNRISKAAEENGLYVQFFMGIEHRWGKEAAPVNDPLRIIKLHGLFEKYKCKFELVVGSEINNMDVVQAAQIFPNVYVGGMWWFNFRPSTYRDSMQKRFEALPASKCSLIVSDSRSIEWCYGKTLLVKQLVADYLFDQIQLGWVNREDAVAIAGQWLYGSAASMQ